ncbi:hypothetical protein Anacy_4771 [Anabaena cylindrica PCC 7122]|uniref:Uncharacterized protein n=1 Tax=Anabaena cylindrica (strain ATCC 27899 / PCC 7122) TaxID=272123 RepID=K9ZLP3_ANACC|nr:hypothetical protein Anacy_4771 [Anabaena cylindrica PCC 7122]BAY02817.1 hypothetical protein NIES19_20660 [Anabaena cylindrica PCC 7122]
MLNTQKVHIPTQILSLILKLKHYKTNYMKHSIEGFSLLQNLLCIDLTLLISLCDSAPLREKKKAMATPSAGITYPKYSKINYINTITIPK